MLPPRKTVPDPIHTARLDLVPLDPKAMRHLIAGDRAKAEQLIGAALPDEFPTAEDRAGFLPIQLHRMETNPDRRAWLARMMLTKDNQAIGHCGFHGPPEVIGRAEIGYTVFTTHRGQGFAKEAARALVDWALDQGEKQVFASVSPTNEPSLAVVRSLGFRQVGTQEDDVDGLELVVAIER